MFPLIYKSDILHLKNKVIYEYDIQSGGYNVSKAEGLLDDELQERLDKADKKRKQIILGLHARDDKSFTKKLHAGFQKYVNLFIDENDINKDKVIAINKDSVLFYDCIIKYNKFSNVKLTCRGRFSSYLKLGNLQFFYNGSDRTKLVKGITLEDYSNTLIEEVFTVMALSESTDIRTVRRHLYDVRQKYVNKVLSNSYYMELGSMQGYKINTSIAGMSFYTSDLEEVEEFFDLVDITYNYKNIIIPLCNIFT